MGEFNYIHAPYTIDSINTNYDYFYISITETYGKAGCLAILAGS